MEPTADRAVVMTVVVMLGAIGVVGLLGLIWLVHDGRGADVIAPLIALPAAAIGSLGGILASTRTAQPAKEAAEAVGYQKAVNDMNTIAPPTGV